MTGKLHRRKGSGGISWQVAEQEPAMCPGGQEGQCHPGLYQKQCSHWDWERWSSLCTWHWWGRTFSTAFVLEPSLQERCWNPSAFLKGNKTSEGSGTLVLWGTAGIRVWVWRRKGSGETLSLYTTTYLKGGGNGVGISLFSLVISNMTRRIGIKFVAGEVQAIYYEKKIILWKSDQTLE